MVMGTMAVFAAPNPLVGTWRLQNQEVNGRVQNSEPLTLKISQAGGKLTFAFSVPVNNVYFVSMSYTVKPDGTEADIKNASGEKIGTVQIRAVGPLQYKISLRGPNRPDSSGTLTVSADSKILTSEQSVNQPGSSGASMHSKQIFSRY